MTTLIISNDEIQYITKIAASLEDSGLLLEGVTETVQNEVKDPKGRLLSMLLGTLGKKEYIGQEKVKSFSELLMQIV